MTNGSTGTRTDTATRIVRTTPAAVYRALLDPAALVAWLPPEGMQGRVDELDPRPGGRYRVTLTYDEAHDGPGKTTTSADVIEDHFAELVPDERVVQRIAFDAAGPAFAGVMTMHWILRPVREGTEVTIRREGVPSGIRAEDHDIGMRSTLVNLAVFLE